jgi:tetratricopeptide (TPR) repeat protein
MSSERTNNEMASQARALLDRAKELEGQARHADALVGYAEVVEQFGAPFGGALREEVARAAASVKSDDADGEVDILVSTEAPEVGRELGPADVETGQVVAWALVCLGLTLERLDRPEAALVAYDELAARFDGTRDPVTLVRVAWAMYDKALALSRLERAGEALEAFDAVIGKFADATDRRLRPCVSWSLWKKSGLLEEVGRSAEVPAQYELLVARHDEVIDAELADIVAWCMHAIASQLRAAGRVQDALRVYDDLVERFGQTDDEAVRLRVAQAFAMKAYSLGMAGEQEQAVVVCDEMLDRVRDTDQALIRDLLADSLSRKARTLETLDRIIDAVAAFDDSLLLLAKSRDPQLVRRRMDCLLDMATLLDRADREAEAIVVFEGVMSAYNELSAEDRDDHARGKSVLALLQKVIALCAVDSAESADVAVQLAESLGDVTVPSSAPPRPRSEPLAEEEIAALLAELYRGDCWMEFATSGDDPSSLAVMESKALALYQRTAAWLAQTEAWDAPALGAVTLIRQIADGCALLARRWSKSWRAKLSLPSSLLLEFAMQRFGIAEWAVEQGHPLQLSDSTELAEELIQSEHERGETSDPDLASAFIASVRHYEMLAVLCDSPSGPAALHIPELKSFASARINDARQSAGWVWQQEEEAAGVAAARIFIAQAYFVATHDTVPTSNDIFPSRENLREMLRQTAAYAWLENHDVELPEWLEPGAN